MAVMAVGLIAIRSRRPSACGYFCGSLPASDGPLVWCVCIASRLAPTIHRYMLTTLARRLSGLPSFFYALLALALALPVLAVLGSWLQWSGQSADILLEMARTVLPDYALTTLGLCLMVAVGVTVLGLSTAALVTLFDFPGRGVLEWLLLLPLAMPAYVVAYAYTDFLQFSGPLQVALREALGLQGRLWPDVRSVWGAALVFTLSLYPYVYLLARTALVERASGLM